MKAKNIILITSLSAMAIGFCAAGAILMNKKTNTVDEAIASRTTAFTGLYEKITQRSELNVGDKVLIASEDGDVLRDAGGNPGYLYSTTENITLSSNSNIIYANNAYVVELTVCNGTATDSIALKGSYRMGWGSEGEHNGYISYDIRGSSGAHPGSIDYSNVGIAYWKDYTGLRTSIIDDSSWNVSFSDGYINLDNVGGHGRLGFTRGYDNRFVLGGWMRINLFRKVTPLSMNITTPPTKSAANGYHYKRGEKLDFSGMETDVSFAEIDTQTFSYDNDKSFFSHEEYATGSGTHDTPVTFVNTIARNVSIIVDQTAQNYVHVNDNLGDFRGECLFSAYYKSEYEEEGGYYTLGFRVDNGQEDLRQGSVNNGIYTNTSGSRMNSAWFNLVRSGGKYHLAKVLDSGTKYVADNYGAVVLQDSATESNAMDIEYDENNHCAFLKRYGTNRYLRFSGSHYEFSTDTSDRAQLYQQELSDEEYESINTFVDGFHDATKVCVADGKTLGVTIQIWSAQANAFTALTSGAQGVIAGTTYTHNAETYGSINDVVDRYDYIISKYSDTFDDFMDRKGTSSYEDNYTQPSNGLIVSVQQNYVAIIILSISIAVISSFGFALVIRKRKLAK